MKTIIITGSSGFLGKRLVQQWHTQFTLCLPHRKDMNITDAHSVEAYFKQKKPDYVLHLAAMTQTLACEENPDQAYGINVLGTKNVAKACKRVQAKLIFFSTEQVFNGNLEAGPYNEECKPQPNTVYGTTKLLAEQLIPSILDEYWILRLTWLFVYPHESSLIPPKDILGLTLHNLKQSTQTRVATNEYRGITCVWEVIENLPKIWALPFSLYHFGSPNNLSRANVVELIHTLHVGNNPTTSPLPTVHYAHAVRRDVRLDCHKLAQAGIIFKPTEEAIRTTVKKIALSK